MRTRARDVCVVDWHRLSDSDRFQYQSIGLGLGWAQKTDQCMRDRHLLGWIICILCCYKRMKPVSQSSFKGVSKCSRTYTPATDSCRRSPELLRRLAFPRSQTGPLRGSRCCGRMDSLDHERWLVKDCRMVARHPNIPNKTTAWFLLKVEVWPLDIQGTWEHAASMEWIFLDAGLESPGVALHCVIFF